MSTDPVLDRFRDLADFPGKRPPANRQPVAAPVESEGWDEKPTYYTYRGVQTEFFTIRHLAHALGRQPVTIRSWENKGKMPRTPYRSPTPERGSLPNKAVKGRRLWTRAQIEGILKIAQEEGVILTGKPPTTRFAHRVSELFQSLINQEKA